MEFETRKISFNTYNNNLIEGEIKIFEQDPDNEEQVLIQVTINHETFRGQEENFFSALQVLRAELEKKNLQIRCNGSAENVYPSPMQLSMGSGRLAYKLFSGHQAKTIDIVDIFDYDDKLRFVSTEEQTRFYNKWRMTL